MVKKIKEEITHMDNRFAEYARLLVSAGVNIQKGQRLQIFTQTEAADLAVLCAKEAYALGAAEVRVHFQNDAIDRLRYLHANDVVFDEPDIRGDAFWQGVADRHDAYLRIDAANPSAFEGVDGKRLARDAKARRAAQKPMRDEMDANRIAWCIGAYVTEAWAKEVFPELSDETAKEKLWNAVYTACMVTGDGQSAQKWTQKQTKFAERVEKLNSMNLVSLRYASGIGTDLTIGLPENHFWEGGCSYCNGYAILPNLPTEEIFTSPDRRTANGTIIASMPLYLSGVRVDGIRMTLKDGKIVEAHADCGEDVLTEKLNTDEGSRYLGECALVGWDSPIRETGILFKETLFDENASCHFAFGSAYPMVRGCESWTKEQRLAAGLNVSDTHVDFMIGTRDLSVTGITKDGQEIALMRDGMIVV